MLYRCSGFLVAGWLGRDEAFQLARSISGEHGGGRGPGVCIVVAGGAVYRYGVCLWAPRRGGRAAWFMDSLRNAGFPVDAAGRVERVCRRGIYRYRGMVCRAGSVKEAVDTMDRIGGGLAEALLRKHSALRRLDPENLYHALCKVLACWGPRGRPPRHWGGKTIERLGKKLVEEAAWVLREVRPWTRGGFDNLCTQRLMWRYEEAIPRDVAEEYTRSYIEEMRREITGFLEEENYNAIAYLELDEKPQFLVKTVTEQVIWPLLEKRINEAAQRSPREALRLINKTLRQISSLESLAHLAELLRRKKEMIQKSVVE